MVSYPSGVHYKYRYAKQSGKASTILISYYQFKRHHPWNYRRLDSFCCNIFPHGHSTSNTQL